MAAGAIYSKTALGISEVTNRKLKLSPRLRTMLILIDGAQPEFILREEAEKVGAPPDFLEQLMAQQLIERSGQVNVTAIATPSEQVPEAEVAADEFVRFRAAKDLMNVTIVDALGLKSFFFTLKLERASNRADLQELLEPYREAILKAQGKAQADVLLRRLQEMLK